MSGANSDHLHRSTLTVYSNLMENFNPGLQKLVTLGNNYVKAFQALALTSEAYFSSLAKLGEQALHTFSSHSLGDVLIQISETQRKLMVEAEGVFHWFQVEVLQNLDKNVKLDEEYIQGSRRVYELEVRNQAATLERHLRRGAYRDSLEGSEYMQYLRQSQHEILREEERRYRFLTEKHCGLSHSLLYLLNKSVASLQPKAEGWREQVNESRSVRPRTPNLLDQDTQLRASGKDHQLLGRVPSRAPSPLPSRVRSGSVGESLGLAGSRSMRALVSHPASSNLVLLPFSRGDVLTLLVPEAQNGWLYGRHDSTLRQGWFPASYVAPLDNFPSLGSSGASLRSHSMSNLLEPTNQSEVADFRGHAEIQPPATPIRRASLDVRAVSPLPDRKAASSYETKTNQKSYNEIPPPGPLSRRASGDFRPVSPLPDRRAESHFESKIEPKNYSEIPPTAPPIPKPTTDVRPISPLPEKKEESSSERANPQRQPPEHPLFPRGSNPFATVKLRPTVTNDRSAPRIH
ncbi:brain-specific angiogenesis inhibitor 1-associated protein 2-like protein 2 [Electrophorus electricus]|uniref:brain-specific angiogenesis inhibitor 1-associated protein 2-like protein 2 n=1 Tax=Electrophorus electricus TaxID=8005 RepID=UPI0015D021BA|nr:brain-specific angiogenesis inhibitor 1-associated protein 2-like protein 2 [Electrophorus electricus]